MESKTDIIWLDSVDSTNAEARRRISEIDNLSVLSALSQSSGRGQQGTKWYSMPGKDLTFSIVLKDAGIKARDQFYVSELAALTVVEFLSSYGITAQIKWPNDIYAGDRKICGILIENSVCGSEVVWSIIGIGLNINQKDFPADLPNPTSMSQCNNTEYDIRRLLIELTDLFSENCRNHLSSPESRSFLKTSYVEKMWRKDIEAGYIDMTDGERFNGKIRGVSDTGLLIMEKEKGELRKFAFKEISYIV